jgi:hypothetical protein
LQSLHESATKDCFINAFPLKRRVPQGLKPAFFQALNGTAEEAAEKVSIGRAATKGAINFEGLAVSLKRYPDTKPDDFRNR